MKNLPIIEKAIRIAGGSKLKEPINSITIFIMVEWKCSLPTGTRPVMRQAIPPKIKPPLRVVRWPKILME